MAEERITRDTEHRRLGIAASAWLSTARWAGQQRFVGRLFSARNGKPTFKNIVEPVAQTILGNDANTQAACTTSTADLTVERTNSTYDSSVVRTPDRARHERVILFAPGPITETALRRANLRNAEVIRQRYRRRRRLRWLSENAVTIVVVFGLLVMAWFVADR